ncbi:MAG: VWA domain-containing protein [Anaerolineales bacterium]|nr:VWA domain-containing protein [Anaerolineales bacterium]
MTTEQPNYYALLGLKTDATPEMIQQAFASLRAKFAKKIGDPKKSPQFQQVAYAYEVLSDPDRRSLYDSLLQETRPPALRVDVLPSRDKVAVLDAPQLVYLLVNVLPPQQTEDTRLPLNLCLVLDRSTSMQGERLNRVKTAVELLLDRLGADDIISVVTFSDRAEVLLPAGSVQNKAQLLGKVRTMTASGGTEIYQGLLHGVEQMRQVSLAAHTNHLILLTDGHTYGDADQCLQLARETAAQGIGITAFGIGSEWNDQFLDRLVSPSGGQSGYIDDPAQIIDFLQKRIKGLGAVYARNVKMLLEFPQSVSLRYAFKLSPYAQPIATHLRELQLGDIEGRKPLTFLLEINIPPQPVESRIKIPVALQADIPSQQMKEQDFRQQLQLLVLTEVVDVPPPETLLRAVRMLNMYRLNEKVWEDVESGQVHAATRRMQHLTTRFLEAGQTKLAQQANLEAERLAQMGTLSTEGRKSLKFGTRALLTQTADWEEDDSV